LIDPALLSSFSAVRLQLRRISHVKTTNSENIQAYQVISKFKLSYESSDREGGLRGIASLKVRVASAEGSVRDPVNTRKSRHKTLTVFMPAILKVLIHFFDFVIRKQDTWVFLYSLPV
jgi:hypothetical protein